MHSESGRFADSVVCSSMRVAGTAGEPLGSMGGPIKVLIDGSSLYLCCQGCVAKVEASPEKYLAKVTPSPESR